MQPETLQPSRPQPVDDALLQEIVGKIVERFHPRRIVLFGSRARRDHQPDSDVDLFVEMDTQGPQWERRERIEELFSHRWWPMDVLVYTPDEVTARRGSLVSIVPVIEEEGVVLYERHAGST